MLKFFEKLFLIIFKFILSVLKIIVPYMLICLSYIFNTLNIYLFIPLTSSFVWPYICSFFIFFTNAFLFLFVSIPWMVWGLILKPIVIYITIYIQFCIKVYWFISLNLCFVFNSIKYYYNKIFTYIYNIYVFFWKKVIDLLFFDFWGDKEKICEKIVKFTGFFLKIFILYLLFYKNWFNFCYNYIFSYQLDKFLVWNRDTYMGVLYIYLSFMNPDNFVLLLYIIFIRHGLYSLYNMLFDEVFFRLGLSWINLYSLRKAVDPNFSFIKFFVDSFIDYISIYIPSTESLLVINNTPTFYFFGMLFFTTVFISWFFFSYLSLYGMFKLNVTSLFLFWISLLSTSKLVFVDHRVFHVNICDWAFLTLNTKLNCYFFIDTISFGFMLLTTTIALFVYIYTFSYFRHEPLVDRFLLFILSFVISMIFLVTSGNTVMLFLGWELIGLTSFFLINFWTTKTATLKSAFKAFTFNKISDFFIFMFLIATYSVFYTFDIESLNNQTHKYENLYIYLFNIPINYLEFISFMLLGAAFIKSAQICGHVWLPDSMEAPVPASSLIHSATLVSAGVYLILRFGFIFDCTEFSRILIPIIGSLTAAYGGVCAVFQSDIKKTLAYSTISHCGFLMVLCSTKVNEFTILYLYVHGFFKAGVFMCAGNVLRIARGYQDTRRMGGLLKYLPFEYYCGAIGLFNLAGLPFTFGFFIKHYLLVSLGSYIYIYYFVVFNSLIGAFAGLFYSYRLMTNTFNDFKKGHKVLYSNLNRIDYNSDLYTNSSKSATLSIFYLFVFSYIITYFLFKYLLLSNFTFSDFSNNTLLNNYYSLLSSFDGYLLNFSYINWTVILIIVFLLSSKYRRIPRIYLIYITLMYFILFCLFIYIFYMFI